MIRMVEIAEDTIHDYLVGCDVGGIFTRLSHDLDSNSFQSRYCCDHTNSMVALTSSPGFLVGFDYSFSVKIYQCLKLNKNNTFIHTTSLTSSRLFPILSKKQNKTNQHSRAYFDDSI